MTTKVTMVVVGHVKGGRTYFLLALMISALTTHPFRDRTPVILLVDC